MNSSLRLARSSFLQTHRQARSWFWMLSVLVLAVVVETAGVLERLP
jgi:hypothetical protein